MADATRLEWVGGGPSNIWTACYRDWHVTVVKTSSNLWWWRASRGDVLDESDYQSYEETTLRLEAAKAAVERVIAERSRV